MDALPAQRWGREVETVAVGSYRCKAYSQRPRCLAELLTDSLRWGERTFIVEGRRRLSFVEHAHTVGGVGVRLRAAGVRQGDRVLLLGFNRLEWVLAFWAVQSIGAVTVLGNAWWSEVETAQVVEEVAPDLVISDRPSSALPPGCRLIGFDELAGCEDAEALTPTPREDDPAVIIFSSGTTGGAKGVVMSHRAVIANVQNLLILTGRLPSELPEDHVSTVSLLTVPLFHLAGVQISFSTLLSGGTLVFQEGRFEPEKVLALIQRERVRVWGGIPTMVSRVIEHPNFPNYDTSSIRSIPIGGAAVSPELRARLREAFPQIKQRVGSLYGLTEAGGVLAAGSGRELDGRPGCVGRPLPVVDIAIEGANPAGVGEIVARTPTASTRYLGAATPIPDEDGWIRTGDLGRLDTDGLLYVVGRSKDIIIRGGENVAAVHVERCLATHPDVLEVAVVALFHADLGEEVAAAIVLRPGASAHPAEHAARAAKLLAKFEIPSRWWFRAEALPVNATGKVTKQAIIAAWPTSDGHAT